MSEDEHSSSEDADRETYWPVLVGTPLAQVFSVKLKHNDGAQKFEVYGTVSVEHWMGTLHIYDKQPHESECVHQGGPLSLLEITDYRHVIYAGRGFIVYVDLKDKDGNEFIKGSLNVPHSDVKFSIPDKSHVKDVQGIKGVATIYYGLLKVATPYEISARITRSESSDHPVEVYGRVVAWYGKRFSYGEDEEANEHCRIVVFDKKKEEAVKVRKAKAGKSGTWTFLFYNSNLAAPIYTPLVVQADFRCVCADGTEVRFQDQFERPPNYIQTMIHEIKRNPGQLQVLVSGTTFITPR